MGLGGRVRYTQILGYMNTSLILNPENGLILIASNNHGFDREKMPEYHLYVEARDNDGRGNSAQVRMILDYFWIWAKREENVLTDLYLFGKCCQMQLKESKVK